MLSKKRRSLFFVVLTNRYATRHRSSNKGTEWMGCNVYACNRRIKCMYVHVQTAGSHFKSDHDAYNSK